MAIDNPDTLQPHFEFDLGLDARLGLMNCQIGIINMWTCGFVDMARNVLQITYWFYFCSFCLKGQV